MMVQYTRKVSFIAMLVLICSHAFSQYGYPTPLSYTWKKQVGRLIDIPAKKASSARARKKQKPLYQLIIEAWKDGDVALYSNADQSFSRKLDTAEVRAIINADPYNYRPLSRYRILEEWTYNPTNGKTQIQILGIAPMREIYDRGGEYRGKQATFWIKYSDYYKLMVHDQQLHGAGALVNCIWNDYFVQLPNDPPNKSWQAKATRTITLTARNDTISHHLTEYSDNSLFEILLQKRTQWQDAIPTYSNDDLTTSLDKWAPLDKGVQKSDTQVITDPVSNREVTKYLQRSFYDPASQQYNIVEHWSFNPAAGKTEIELMGIAPIARLTINYSGVPKTNIASLFWMKYKDVWPVISKYDQYNPGNSFALHIWDNYFLSDIKPIKKANSPAR